jgi:hypothetical protein
MGIALAALGPGISIDVMRCAVVENGLIFAIGRLRCAQALTPPYSMHSEFADFFPVICPVISLLTPCYDFSPEATFSNVHAEIVTIRTIQPLLTGIFP